MTRWKISSGSIQLQKNKHNRADLKKNLEEFVEMKKIQ